jgi:hypothetical protein
MGKHMGHHGAFQATFPKQITCDQAKGRVTNNDICNQIRGNFCSYRKCKIAKIPGDVKPTLPANTAPTQTIIKTSIVD